MGVSVGEDVAVGVAVSVDFGVWVGVMDGVGVWETGRLPAQAGRKDAKSTINKIAYFIETQLYTQAV